LKPVEERGALTWMAKNRVAANVLMLVLIVGGLVTLASGVKQEVFPAVDLDEIMVLVAYPGASPAEVEQGVVLAIEEAVGSLDGIKEIRASATEGAATVNIELLLGTDTDRALNEIRGAIDRIASFPENVERPSVSVISTGQQVVSLVLYGDVDEATLRAVAQNTRTTLLDDPRITSVELSGVRPLEISVEVPQRRLRQHQLTLTQIASRIRAASVEVPGGGVKTEAGEVLLRTTERRDSGEEFGSIIVSSRSDGSQLRLRDIAVVKDGFRETGQNASFDGKRAAMVNIFRVGAQTPLEVAAATKEHVARLEKSLPQGLSVALWFDRSDMYEGRIDLMLKNARIGLLLVLMILGLFLEARLAFWVTFGIPVSFVGSLLFFPIGDVSINMISLFAFIITLGMVVDDAIVVGEAIYQRRSDGEPPLAAAVAGVKEVAHPVVFSILTTCVAFSPLLFVPGVAGKFFRVTPVVVIAVLLISLIESLFVLPAHLSHPMPAWLRAVLFPYLWVMRGLGRLDMPRRLQGHIDGFYIPVLKKALEWRYFTLACGVAMAVVTAGFVIGRVPFTFLPKIDGDVITVQLQMPGGTPVAETQRITGRIATAARTIMESERPSEDYPLPISRGLYEQVGARISIEPDSDGPARKGGTHLSTVMAYLVDQADRRITTAEFVRRWRESIGEIPGVDSLLFIYGDGITPAKALHFELTHDDIETLELAARRLAREMGVYRGLVDIGTGVVRGKEQLDFRLTEAAVAQGLTEAELARQVRAAFFGAEAVRQQRGRDEVRVYVRLPLEERRSLYNVEELVIRTPTGGEMPLAHVAHVTRGRAYTAVDRTNRRRSIAVTADVSSDSANANRIISEIRKRELPRLLADVPGLRFALGGEMARQVEALGSLALGFFLAHIVMFAILAVAFRSYLQPLLVMSAIPFGMVGAVWGHVVMGYDLSLVSVMGVVALSGVVCNDSLILIVTINRNRKAGMHPLDAVVSACQRRFRPIFLTSVTTFFGLAPMIIETSVQARFLVPMAIALGFGILFATVIMLLIVPCNFLILEDAREYVARVLAGWRSQSSAPTVPIGTPAKTYAEAAE
jgi:multidrug efflux pump subunit AcrB